jgi:hypothetical protein
MLKAVQAEIGLLYGILVAEDAKKSTVLFLIRSHLRISPHSGAIRSHYQDVLRHLKMKRQKARYGQRKGRILVGETEDVKQMPQFTCG